MAPCVVAVDIGGTFTDIALADLEASSLWTTKTPTTPHDQSQGFVTGIVKILQQAGKAPHDVVAILHGSTVATNMIAKGRHDVPKNAQMYLWVKPPRLVTPEHIYEVPERLQPPGVVQQPLDESACVALLQRLQTPLLIMKCIGIPNAGGHANNPGPCGIT